MKIKRYVVKEMYEAIKLIKQDLGPEAVIVSSYRVPPKGLVGFFMPKLLEVTAALDDQPQEDGRRVKKVPLKLAAAGGSRISKQIKTTADVVPFKQQLSSEQRTETSGKQNLLDILESVEMAAKSEGLGSAEAVEADGTGSDYPAWSFGQGASPGPSEITAMSGSEAGFEPEEAFEDIVPGFQVQQPEPEIGPAAPGDSAESVPNLNLIRPGIVVDPAPADSPGMVAAAGQLSLAPVPAAPGSSLFGLMVKNELALAADFDNWRQSLLDMDVEENIADMLLSAFREDTAGQISSPDGAYMSVRKKAIELLEPAYKPVNKARVLTFVGPNGVGKTTTLAKMATLLSLNEQKSVALVSVQSYRLGPSEQLQEYGKILGAPAEVVMTPDELIRVMEKHSDKDYVLIDTAGRSARNSGLLLELKSFINAVLEPQEVYLVLSITTKNRDLHRTVREYLRVGCTKLIFTKLDETDTFGSILNMVVTHGLPAAYLTDGQVIPDCINEAGPRSVSELLLRGIINR